LEEILQGLIDRFNEKATKDVRLRDELGGVDRTIQIEAGEEKYHFRLRDGQISGLSPGVAPNPDVMVVADRATMVGLLRREIPPMKALATGRLKIKASLEDMLRLRKLF
jgi:putative sterol carrier protein